jgi:polysaccharide pyruvyl transferase WcaK-like protein
VVRRWIAGTSVWIRSIVDADFVGDIRGGDSFSDIYGAKNFVLGCLPALSAIWIRGGIHLLPQTYGPFQSKVAERFARYILLRALSIWCRDRVSLKEVSRLTDGRRSGALCPDVAFALEAIRPDSLAVDVPLPGHDGETLIGINISGLMYHGAHMFGLQLDYRTFVKSLVEQILLDPSNRILLVPHTFGAEGRVESDPSACRDLQRRLSPLLRDRVHLVTAEYDQHGIKGVIGMCDFFIGSRMHACIAALSQGIPAVGVAYSRKFAGVFDMVGAADWVVDGRTTGVQEALSRVEELVAQRDANRSILRARVTAARKELFQAFEQVIGAPTSQNGKNKDGSPALELTTSPPTVL